MHDRKNIWVKCIKWKLPLSNYKYLFIFFLITINIGIIILNYEYLFKFEYFYDKSFDCDIFYGNYPLQNKIKKNVKKCILQVAMNVFVRNICCRFQ